MSEPLEVVLGEEVPKIEIDGNTYTLKPLRLQEIGQFRDWVKERRLSTFMRAAKDAGLDPKQFTESISEILGARPEAQEDENGDVTVSDDVIEQMGTEEGMQHLLFLSIRRSHPDFTIDDLDLGFQDMEKLISIVGEISGLNMSEDEESDSGNPPKVTENDKPKAKAEVKREP
jgi:hypothetical protein